MDQTEIRLATAADADTLVAHRRAMFFEMGHRDEATLDGMCAAFRPWLLSANGDGRVSGLGGYRLRTAPSSPGWGCG